MTPPKRSGPRHNAEDHIRAISKDYMANARVQESLDGAMRHVQRSFTRRGHLLMEFIQNAEDAGATRLEVTLDDAGLTIYNDGVPFEYMHVESISKIGKSTKTAKEYIGYLGVGFKSTFLVADYVAVHSGEYHFAFDKSAWPAGLPWQIAPVWVKPESAEPSWETMFKLRQLNAQAAIALKDSFASFDPRMLLWLDSLRSLRINDGTRTREFDKVCVGSNRWRLRSTDGGADDSEEWLLITGERRVPDNVRADQTTKDWERDDIEVRRLAAAFRLDANGNLIREPKGTAYITIYSYTPLKDEATSLRFLVQGDFITSPNRDSVLRDAEWNRWLAHEIYCLIRDEMVPNFLRDKNWHSQFQDILVSEPTGGHPIWDDLIRRPLEDFVRTAPIFPAADGSLVVQEDAIRISAKMTNIISDAELAILHPGKKRVADQLNFEVETTSSDSLHFVLDERTHTLLSAKAAARDVPWFANLYRGLSDNLPLTRHFRNRVRGAAPFLLTEDYELASVSEALIAPPDVEIPSEVRGNFQLIQPELVSQGNGYDVSKIMRGLEVRVLTDEIVKKAITENELPRVRDEWDSLDDAEKISWIRLFKDRAVGSSELAFLTVPTKGCTWLPPAEVLLGSEFHPVPDLENLLSIGLLGEADVAGGFLAPTFLDDPDDLEERRSWVSFFEAIKVGALDQNRRSHLAQRVATMVALRYEQGLGNSARELPESESHTVGYDIESKTKTGVRRVEAKGRTTNMEITVTPPQWKALLSDSSTYFVHVVTDALSADPILNVVPGSSLESIEFSLRIQPGQWKTISQPPVPFSSFAGTGSS